MSTVNFIFKVVLKHYSKASPKASQKASEIMI